jgi:hypothetical protein
MIEMAIPIMTTTTTLLATTIIIIIIIVKYLIKVNKTVKTNKIKEIIQTVYTKNYLKV